MRRDRRGTKTLLAGVLSLACAAAASGGVRPVERLSGEALVSRGRIPAEYEAVGTVRPVTEARVMAQASGRILEVRVREGERVAKGDLLARIDDRQLGLRVAQAREGVHAAEAQQQQAAQAKLAAEAAFEQAKAEHSRVKSFLKQRAATPQQMEQAEAAFKQAGAQVARADFAVQSAAAGVARAREALAEAKVFLEHSAVEAPIGGVVTARQVEPGDLAWPGRGLLTVTDLTQMRLEVNVPEGMAGRVVVGRRLRTKVDALDFEGDGKVAEIVPATDPVSRTFVVKVDLAKDARLVSGMFGRVAIPLQERTVLQIPRDALRRIGQLQMVTVLAGSKKEPTLRMVRVGELLPGGTHYEVLSGLAEGEIVRTARGGHGDR